MKYSSQKTMSDSQRIPDLLADHLSIEHIERDARAFYETDKTYCYRDMLKTADHVASLLRETGARVNTVSLKADGETAYLDYIMPQAWDVDAGRLEIIQPSELPCSILADHAVDRFVIPNRCMATPPEGITAELVRYDETNLDAIRGKWVLLKVQVHLVKEQLIAHGAAGIVSYFSESGDSMPDTVFWHNGWSQGTGWYHCKAEPRIVMFSISPRRGQLLENLLAQGRTVVLKGVVSSRTYDGTIKTVCGVIPGKKKQEIIVLGHMYEPLADDNAAGNAAMVEMCRTISRLIKEGTIPQPYYSIRFMFSMERYGMGQFFQSAARRRNTLAAISVDSIAMDQKKTGEPDRLFLSTQAFPFFGDMILNDLVARHNTYSLLRERGGFGDDAFMADPMIGVPVLWYWCFEGRYHHNTANTFEALDWKNCLEKTGIILRYVSSLAWLDPAGADRLLPRILRGVTGAIDIAAIDLREKSPALDRESLERNIRFILETSQNQLNSLARFGVKPSSLRRALEQIERRVKSKAHHLVPPEPSVKMTPSLDERRARNIIPRRLTRGLPFDLARMPFPERKRLIPDQERFVAWMDGRRDLWEVMQFYSIDRGKPLTPDEIKPLLDYTRHIAAYGYLKLVPKTIVDKKTITRGLRKLGIRKGDRIIVHSSLSSLGHVRGGARTVIKALMETVTRDGLLMMPSFNHGEAFTKGPGYYAPTETPTTNGIIADTFWRMPGVKRSLDPTHPVAAWGKDACEYLKRHSDVPSMGAGSPIQRLEEVGGKAVLLGTGYDPNSFRHVVEMTNHVKCLGVRTEQYPVILPNGRRSMGRTWTWREGSCPLLDKVQWSEERMIARKLEQRTMIGNAVAIVFLLNDFRTVAEELLREGLPGIPCCRDCTMKIGMPFVKDAAVPSDWHG